jgi:hypothetical protein
LSSVNEAGTAANGWKRTVRFRQSVRRGGHSPRSTVSSEGTTPAYYSRAYATAEAYQRLVTTRLFVGPNRLAGRFTVASAPAKAKLVSVELDWAWRRRMVTGWALLLGSLSVKLWSPSGIRGRPTTRTKQCPPVLRQRSRSPDRTQARMRPQRLWLDPLPSVHSRTREERRKGVSPSSMSPQ